MRELITKTSSSQKEETYKKIINTAHIAPSHLKRHNAPSREGALELPEVRQRLQHDKGESLTAYEEELEET